MARRDSLDIKTLLILAAIGGGVYVVVQALDLGKKAGAAFASAGEAIGSGLFDFFHPDQVGETLFYTVRFPDGKQHAVPSQSVDASGYFTMDGKLYQMLVDKSITSGVNKTAFLV